MSGVRYSTELAMTNLKSQISNLKSQISNLKSQISNLKSQISNLKSQKPPISNLKFQNASRGITKLREPSQPILTYIQRKSGGEPRDCRQPATGDFSFP
jgi:archaellum component FlaC